MRYKRVRFVTRKRKEKLPFCKGLRVRGERLRDYGLRATDDGLRVSVVFRFPFKKLLSPCIRETRGEASERVD